jgi:ribosomal protein S12 methylthiotransferase
LKTKGNQSYKVNIVTLGCSKNTVDSEVLMGQLSANGINVSHEQESDEAQVVVINTCGFIERAKQESIDTILRYAEARQSGRIDKLYVTGCLSERYRDDLQKEIKEVDAWFGTRELPQLLKKFKADYKHELLGERQLTTPGHYAFFKISEGCDRPCSFCAIPLMRGMHVSKPKEQLVKEAAHLASRGVKELVLIAQDLTYYGLDLYKTRDLADLLKQLAGVDGIKWIRLQYAYPSQFPLEVLEVMKDHSNICKYLDMPLQHISDPMLKSMRRGITKRRTIELVETIRKSIPELALRTTLIAGHPGETEQDFKELADFVNEQRFDRLGIFTYSHEEKTHSFSLEDNVPEEVKQERADAIMAIQEGISWDLNQKKIGKDFNVLIDRKEGDFFIGRTEYDSPEVDNEVLIPAHNIYLPTGGFVKTRIVDATEFDLFGEPLQP